MLHGSGLLDGPPEAGVRSLDRRAPAGDRRGVAALLLVDRERVVVKSLSTAEGCADEVAALALSEPLAEYLLRRAGLVLRVSRSSRPTRRRRSGSAASCWAGSRSPTNRQREWSAGHPQVLQDAAAAVSTEVGLRLAKREAARVQDLVSSHNTLHELIASRRAARATC